MVFYSNSTLGRPKREMSLADQCKALDYSDHATGLVADIAGDINSIPIIGQTVGIVTSCVAMVAHIANAGVNIAKTALDCDDIPFNEIKEIMDKRFNEVDRKLDQNTAALAEVSKMVSKTFASVEKVRKEMREGFNQVLDSIESSVVKSLVADINGKIDYFSSEKERIVGLRLDDYITKIEKEDGILDELKDYQTSKDNSLRMLLFKIINNDQADPITPKDSKAFLALDALYYGTQTYAAVMFFLIQQYTYLAEYNYQNGNLEEFNKNFDEIQTVFGDFKASLTENANSLIGKVVQILNKVQEKRFVRENREQLKKYSDYTISLSNLKSEINKLRLPLINDVPSKPNIKFHKPDINLTFGAWKNYKQVRYAVQYEKNNVYSKVSDWSDKITIDGKTNPFIKVPVASDRRNRLVFRKFENETPEFIGIVKSSVTEFRDLNRDLYNAAGEKSNKSKAKNQVQTLIEKGSDVSAVFEKGRNAIHAAAEAGNDEVTTILLSNPKAPDINMADKEGYTPLHVAVSADNPSYIRDLLGKGVNPNLKSSTDQSTPLHIATKNGFSNSLKSLLQSDKVKVNERNKLGFTALHNAVAVGTSVVEPLLSRSDIDVNAKAKSGFTPLHMAVMSDDLDTVKALTNKQGINLNALDNDNSTPLHHAAILGNKDIIKHLLTLNGINVNIKQPGSSFTPLHYAIFFRKADAALELIKAQNIDLKAIIEGNLNFLHFAVVNGLSSVVLELINKGLEMEAKTSEGFTPLHLAAQRKEEDIAKVLIDGGANIMAKSSDDETPLHLAAAEGRENTVSYLINKGADVGSLNAYNQTPLFEAAINNYLGIAKLLFQKDPESINIINMYGASAFDIAALKGHLDIVQFIFEEKKKAGNEFSDNEKLSAICKAIARSHPLVVSYLLDQNTDINGICKNGKSLMTQAIYFSNVDVAKSLVDHGYELQRQSFSDLHAVAEKGKVAFAKYFIEDCRFQVDVQDGTKSTPLYFAVTSGYVDVAEYLFSKGANPYAENVYGDSPYKYAQNRKYDKLVDLFNTRPKRSLENNKEMTNKHNTKYLNSDKSHDLMFDSETNKLSNTVNNLNHYSAVFKNVKLDMKHSKSIENTKSFENPLNVQIGKIDSNGMLLLLDLLIRNFTDEKYKSSANEKVSELESNVAAFNIMENLENIMSQISDKNIGEDIDFVEVYSKLNRAIMGGDEGKILNILCSVVEPISKLNHGQIKALLKRDVLGKNGVTYQTPSLMHFKYFINKIARSIVTACSGKSS